MIEVLSTIENVSKRVPWNKGKVVGAKSPLRPKHVWSIRTKLQVEGRVRDLALFNLAIDSKLRGCDVVALKVDDVAPGGYAVDRASVRQKKTGRPVKFELTETTRQGGRRLPEGDRQETGRISIHRQAGANFQSNYSAIRAAFVRMACQCWAGSAPVRNTLIAPNKGGPDLPEDRQLASRAALVRPHKN